MVKEKLLEITWMSQVPLTWALFLQIPAIIKRGLERETSSHEPGSKRDLSTISSCTLFFTFSDDKFQTYRKIEEFNEHSHTHYLK